MGLDMYAYTVKEEIIGDLEVDIDIYQALEAYVEKNPTYQAGLLAGKEAVAIAKEHGLFDANFEYWRKFNALHGWMQHLYTVKGGVSADFNCNTVRLMPEDLDRLDAEKASLTPTDGFFFGDTDPLTEEDYEAVADFVKKAQQAIKDGYAVIYDSWW